MRTKICRRQIVTRTLKGAGVTLVELVLVIAIISLLAALVVPALGLFRRRAQDAGCMTNLRSLHASFAAYMLDHARVWPQVPISVLNASDDSDDPNDPLAEFYIKALEPYGAHRDTWLCPSERAGFPEDFDPNRFDTSYGVTQFDPTPDIAYKWNQPWLMERGGFHTGVANRVMPDGSIMKDNMPFPAK